MDVGEIFLWNTDKAKGHESRDKYHLYVSECQWEDGHAFLFISKADYGGDFPIYKSDYGFFPLDTSYISLSGIVPYSDKEIQDARPERKGQLSKQHMQDLFHAVAGTEKMVEREKLLVGNALRIAFG
jgi:hypothetical protein